MKEKIDTQLFYKTLDSLFEKKEMDKVEPYMLATLEKAGQLKDLEGVVSVCNELGGFYRAMRRTDEALWTYQKVIDGLKNMGMQGTSNYATALINLGNVYIARKEYDTAYDIDCQALKILDRVGEDTYQMAALCNNMSAALRELGQIKDAESMALQAIQIIRQMPGCETELATSYTNLGQAQARRHAFFDARKSFTHALQLFENCNGDRDIHYAAAVYGLAEVDQAEGDYAAAEQGYLRAAGLIERDFGHTEDYQQIMEDLKRMREKVKKNEGA